MNIGEKLKQLRENNNMTRKDVTDKLKQFGIDISDKTLYGYESGRNSTNADMFLALCQVYKCNNVMETFSNSVDDVLFTNAEWETIQKYRNLDPHGKEMVDMVLDKEHERCLELNKASGNIISIEKPAETEEPDRSYLMPVAAHDDYIDEEGEMEKVLEDLKKLQRPK